MNINYAKVAIYVLTFMGYLYSGYGSGLLSNLKEAILSAEMVFGTVFENAVKVAKQFQTLNDVFDAAVEENCIFKCPSGAPARSNKNHKASGNGCGSLGLNIASEYLPVAEMTRCCDNHDICYDTCNSDKELCDLEFKRCLYKYCDSYEKGVAGSSISKTCKGAAKLLFTGTLALGCKSYLDAQTNACYCPTQYGWKDKNNYKYKGGDEL